MGNITANAMQIVFGNNISAKITRWLDSEVTSNGHFDPDRVPRVVFRWTRPALRPGEMLGLNFAPDGKYVFASDYDALHQMYRELKHRMDGLEK